MELNLIRAAKMPGHGRKGLILCFLVVRNESLRLPAVLDHHRRIGIDHFFVVDNGSTDDTRELIAQQPDVTLYSAEGSYTGSRFGLNWIHPLLDEFATNHWSLTIDADELFVYPNCERLELRAFCDLLEGKGASAVCSIMLDMYSDRPIAETSYAPGGSLLQVCPYFDSGPYGVVKGSGFLPGFELRGGPRLRVFSDKNSSVGSPTISKIPLVRWHPSYRYTSSTHYIRGNLSLSNLMGALLHFKFLFDFRERAKSEAFRGEHFAGGREYKTYAQKLSKDELLTFYHSGSVRYESSRQLAGLELRCVLKGRVAF
jgi:glycosyltransferase involved in cell wall biosynthesis